MSSRLFKQRVRSARRWMRRATKQKSCEAAYSDLLLATRDFGVACGLVNGVPPRVRTKCEHTLARLEEALLAASHNVRPKCR
jgi:hypothetical protein